MTRVVLVTGASSGIGAATARRFAEEPRTELVLVARREARLQALAQELGGATVVAADLTATEAPAHIAAVVEREHGRLDVLVNNAGAGWDGRFAETGWANVARTMELNFNAQVRLTEALLPLLRRSAPSAIVNVSSTAGRVSRAGSGAYSASKFAVVSMSEGLALELKPLRIGVSVLCPGFVRTRIMESERHRAQRYGTALTPDGKSSKNATIVKLTELANAGIDAVNVARRAVSAIRNDELYVFTHLERRLELDARFAAILGRSIDKPSPNRGRLRQGTP